jgi:autoinducer 2-degrading protein
MYVLVVHIRLKPENVDVWMEKSLENAREARKEPGCRQFDVLADPKDRTRVMLYEVYADEKAFEAHQQTPHFKKYFAEAVPLAAGRERQFWTRVSG